MNLKAWSSCRWISFSPFPVDRNGRFRLRRLFRKKIHPKCLSPLWRTMLFDRVGGVLAGAGLYARHVDVEVLGYWRLIKRACRIARTRIPDDRLSQIAEVTDLIAVQSGVPVIFRSLGAHGSEDEVEYAEEVFRGSGIHTNFARGLSGASVAPTHVLPVAQRRSASIPWWRSSSRYVRPSLKTKSPGTNFLP